jgi:hypothetical protein
MKKQLLNPVALDFLAFLNIMSYLARISALPTTARTRASRCCSASMSVSMEQPYLPL